MFPGGSPPAFPQIPAIDLARPLALREADRGTEVRPSGSMRPALPVQNGASESCASKIPVSLEMRLRDFRLRQRRLAKASDG